MLLGKLPTILVGIKSEPGGCNKIIEELRNGFE
jgi:hypothetical protein